MIEICECRKTLFVRMGVLVLIDLKALVIGCRSGRALKLSLHMSAVELRSDEVMRMAALIITNWFFGSESAIRLINVRTKYMYLRECSVQGVMRVWT